MKIIIFIQRLFPITMGISTGALISNATSPKPVFNIWFIIAILIISLISGIFRQENEQ